MIVSPSHQEASLFDAAVVMSCNASRDVTNQDEKETNTLTSMAVIPDDDSAVIRYSTYRKPGTLAALASASIERLAMSDVLLGNAASASQSRRPGAGESWRS